MSIRDGLPSVPAGASDESPETALIARLAKEFFAESGGERVSPRPTSLTPGLLEIPATGVPAPSTPSPANSELAGGYPRASSTNHPPVHPVLESSPSPVPDGAGLQPPLSGAHDPSCQNSYAFGEPRRNGSLTTSRGPTPATPAPELKPEPRFDALSAPSVLGTHSEELYFLRETKTPNRPESLSPSSSLSVLEIESIRRDFPALHQRVNGHPLVWLDNAATTHKPQRVIDATSEFYRRDNSNIHRAAHTLAARSTELFEKGRERVRQFLGAADAKEIVFVRGTTEAINLVAQSYGKSRIGAGDEILLTRLEHHANIVPWQLLAQQTGATIRVAPINDRGELIIEEFAKLLNSRTKIVSVTHVSNALGTINPLEQLIPLAHAHGVPVLVDGAQSTPHLPINVQALDADFFVFSGHKVFAPTGIGALYGKAALLESMPPWQGGGHMIRDVTFEKTIYQNAPEKFEAGTPDIAGVVGLAAAIEYLFEIGIPALAAYEHSLLEYAAQALSTVPGLRPIGTAANKASVLSFVIPGVANEAIARHLDRQGIAVRAGHHCAQPAQRHFGLESTVRPSLAFYNNQADVDALVKALHSLPRT